MSLPNYVKLKVVGEGSYGVVWKARDKRSGRIVALKEIRIDSPDEGVPSTAVREISLLMELKHPNVVELVEVVHKESSLTLVFEFLAFDLKKCMDRFKGRLPPRHVRSFLFQLIKGTAFIHAKNIIHRDLKPQNLLVDKACRLKLADFGLARAVGIPIRQFTHKVVTLWYRPPEVLMGDAQYGASVDMWSIGCIFAEMLSGKPLFPGRTDHDELMLIFKKMGTPNTRSWPKISRLPRYQATFPSYPPRSIAAELPGIPAHARNLLERMLQMDPARRISAREALQHPYFHRDSGEK